MRNGTPSETRRQFSHLLDCLRSTGGPDTKLAKFTSDLIDQLETLEREKSERQKALALLLDVSQRLTRLRPQAEALDEIVELVCERMEVQRCSVMLLDENRDHLTIEVGRGLQDRWQSHRVEVGDGIAGHVARTGEPLLIRDIENDPRFARRSAPQYGTTSLLCVPLAVDDETIGVLNVNNKQDGSPFSEEDLHLLMTLAANAAISINNARLHRQTEESRIFVTNVVESMNLGVLAVDPNQKVTLINRPSARIFGLEGKRCEGRPYLELFNGKTREKVEELFTRTWEESTVSGLELKLEAPDGKDVPLDCTAVLLRDREANIIGALAIFRDISESRELAELRRLDCLKTNFVHTVSHELRPPLTSVIAAISLLDEGLVGEVAQKHKKLIAILRRNATRLGELVNDILDLSRLEAGEQGPQCCEVSLQELSVECVSALGEAAREKGVNLVCEPGPDSTARVDAKKIFQVLMNLAGNAIKFTPSGGTVQILCRRDEENVLISVKDNGTGIPAEHHEKIFERFYQVEDTMTRTSQGSGLGLPICRRIAEMHGGRIWVESKQGEGSRFNLLLPIQPPKEQEAESTGDGEPVL